MLAPTYMYILKSAVNCNTKSGLKGEVKEKGFKIDKVCYKISIMK